MPALSGFIIALDETDRIGAAIGSLRGLAEEVVVDSGSADGTPARRAAPRAGGSAAGQPNHPPGAILVCTDAAAYLSVHFVPKGMLHKRPA